MITLTTYNPHYGPQGQPYRVKARYAELNVTTHHWTEREALDARDAAFMAGARSVHVSGLPTIGVAGGFPRLRGRLPDIAD